MFINGAEPESVDPAVVTDQVGMRIAESLFEGLCRINAQGKPEPGTAERWDISDDKKRYTFHLRANAVWSTGEPVVAQDFVDSWERALSPTFAADYAAQLYLIRNAKPFNEGKLTDFRQVGVKATDARTLEVELENPTPYFIDLCAFCTLSPVPMKVVRQYGSSWIKPGRLVGNGPYVLHDWRLDDRIVLKKNPRYWDAANVKMATVEVLPIAEPNTAINYFVTGQADLIMDKGMVPTSLTAMLKQQSYFHTGPFLGSYFTRYNVQRPPFNDPRVRQAFALSIDKRRITEKITQLGEATADSLTPPGAGGYQPPPGLGYDVERARKLLAEAGFPGGKGLPSIEYLYFPKPVERNIAVEMQAMWEAALGVKVELVKQEWKVYLDSMREQKYHLCRSSWVGDYNDPNTFLEMFTTGNGNNRTGWASPEYDSLIAAAAAEPDIAKRHDIFRQAETRLIRDECVILPIYFYVGVQFFHADKLQGVQSNMIDDHPFRCMSWAGR